MAASGVSVTVLAPNGRRQTVKVSPNTPLLQVLEDVCKKHGFDPEEHGLKFQRTNIDLSLPWRFANLPNNAKLEIVTCTRKQAVTESQVSIALQMENGLRHQGSFSCEQSLWDVVTHFPQISVTVQSDSGSTPVCVYMRNEVSGIEALKKATLKSLGLTGGSAIVRFLIKSKTQKDEDKTEVTKPAATPTTPPVNDMTCSPPPQLDALPSMPASAAEVPLQNPSSRGPLDTQVPPGDLATSTLPDQQEEASASQSQVEQSSPPVVSGREDGEEAGPSGLNSPSTSSFSATCASAFIPFSGGGQRLGGPGAGEVGRTPASSLTLSSHSALNAAVDSPKAKKAKSSHGSGKCQTAVNQPDDGMEPGQELMEPIERKPLVYLPDSAISSHSKDLDNLPDEFFEVTVDDIRKRFAMLKSERKLLEEAPLMTKASREAQIKEKMERYPRVVLRVQFPDRHILQGFFRPVETVGALRAFVRSHLEDPQLSFYLFITPPKTILNDPSATLIQADLFPGALVHFGSDAKTGVYLKRGLIEASVSAQQANESVSRCILRSPEPSCSSAVSDEPPQSQEPPGDAGTSAQDEQNPSARPTMAKTARADPGTVPKWLKLPGKK
ncbi:tether containing UBX domain for GLUT4 [Takifugu rubripes]|uniref:ASPSCR1 tether for SLC2A4, UBX domain containing n=1 Tax=Takifugu rubripes TaxID=31033 RepID=H2U2W9_TAKRU|nr:tether containing UBX domain for GLUT4 [Takifugu rubripes]